VALGGRCNGASCFVCLCSRAAAGWAAASCPGPFFPFLLLLLLLLAAAAACLLWHGRVLGDF